MLHFKKLAFFSVVLSVLVGFSFQSFAGFFNGKTQFYTIKTEHFVIHYSEGLGQVAEEMREITERVHDRLTKRMHWEPKARTHVVLTDKTDRANGMATLLPQSSILMYTAAPTVASSLDHYKSYYEFLFTHEYTHILHIDQYGGFATPLRKILGNVVAPNAMTPSWMREGVAVYEESLLAEGFGRANSEYTDMILRTSVYENKFPRIDQIAGLSRHFPAGMGAYLYGGRFFTWLADKYGEERMYQYQKEYASSFMVFSLNNKARRVYGKSFYKLWKEFRADMTAQYNSEKQSLMARGVTSLQKVQSHKKDTLSYYTPRPGGGYAYYQSSLDDGARIVVQVPGEKKRTIKRRLFGQMSFSRTGRYLAYSSIGGVEKKRSLSEVTYYDLVDKKFKRVYDKKNPKKSMRATDPDFSPLDGGDRWIVMVRNHTKGDQLYVYDTLEKKGYYLTKEPAKTQLSNPRFSPNGRHIVVSRKDPRTGFRDIVVYSNQGKRLFSVTKDKAADLNPIYSRGGGQIYFSSYRSGVSNIHAYDLKKKKTYQITNVLTGVFEPMPSFHSGEVFVRKYSSDRDSIESFAAWSRSKRRYSYSGSRAGKNAFESGVATLVRNSAHNSAEEPTPTISGPPREMPVDDLNTKNGNGQNDREFPSSYKNQLKQNPQFGFEYEYDKSYVTSGSKKYSAFPNILLPKYLLPNIVVQEGSTLFSLTTGKSDPLYRHSWSAFANYRTDAGFVGGGFSYGYQRYNPSFYFGGVRYAVDRGDVLLLSGAIIPFFEERWRGYAGMNYAWKKHAFNFNYFYEHRSAYTNVNVNVLNMEPYAGVGFKYTYRNYKKYPNSISQENGVYLKAGVDWANQLLGSHDVNEELVAYGDARFYLEMPWSDHHVFALRVAGGWAWGDQQQFGSFRLGGPFGEGVGAAPLSSRVMTLRGLPGITFAGDRVFIFSGAYRFPLATNVNWGIGTWPIFLDKLHMELFVDGGDIAFRTSNFDLFSQMLISVGGELKGDFMVGYGLPITFRAGYAYILTNRGLIAGLTDSITRQSLRYGSVYFQVGTQF